MVFLRSYEREWYPVIVEERVDSMQRRAQGEKIESRQTNRVVMGGIGVALHIVYGSMGESQYSLEYVLLLHVDWKVLGIYCSSGG